MTAISKPAHDPMYPRDITVAGLREGLGVEDIAVRSGVSVETIRFHVRALRARGELQPIYHPEAKP